MRTLDDVIGDLSHIISADLLEELNACIDIEVQDAQDMGYGSGHSSGYSEGYSEGYIEGGRCE